jgi:hypothetical protein
MYVLCYQTGFLDGQIRPDFITLADIWRGYKYIYHFYKVLRSPRIDHLEPTFAIKININSLRTDQNPTGEVW